MLFFIEIQLKGQFTQNQGRFCKEKLLLSFSNDLKHIRRNRAHFH